MTSLSRTLADPKALISKIRVKAPNLVELPRAVRAMQGGSEGR